MGHSPPPLTVAHVERLRADFPDCDIALAVAEERWKDVEAHVQADIEKTAALANKLGFFSHQTAMAL